MFYSGPLPLCKNMWAMAYTCAEHTIEFLMQRNEMPTSKRARDASILVTTYKPLCPDRAVWATARWDCASALLVNLYRRILNGNWMAAWGFWVSFSKLFSISLTLLQLTEIQEFIIDLQEIKLGLWWILWKTLSPSSHIFRLWSKTD